MAHSVFKIRKGEAYPYCYKYPQVALTADCVIFSYDGKDLLVLLVKRGLEPFKGEWALPGGFIKPGETVEEGAKRELFEETSLKAEYMEQIRVFSTPDRDPRQRVVTVPFFALVKNVPVVGGDDAERAEWFPIDKLPELAFDHAQILAAAREALKHSLYFNPVSFDLLPQTFTMPQLQRLYELILGRKFDRRNFARKMNSLGILDYHEPETHKEEECEIDEFNELAKDFNIDTGEDLLFDEVKDNPAEKLEKKLYSAPKRKFRAMKSMPDLISSSLPIISDPEEKPKKKRDKSLPSRIASVFSFNRKGWESMKDSSSDNFEF